MLRIQNYIKHFGIASLIIILITLVLFIVAIFLVSTKLILMTYSNSVSSKKLELLLEKSNK